MVVFTNAKILILKLITTYRALGVSFRCCIYQCKDTNFKANHNYRSFTPTLRKVVFTNAKILILKLITTSTVLIAISNSCIYQCKDTNFKANHNLPYLLFILQIVVFTNAKILILKLITTFGYFRSSATALYLPMQRY